MKNYNKEELKEIRSRAYAHGCQKEGVFISLNWLKREEITAEEKAEALKKWEELKKENAESYTNGEFWLCPMWMDKEGDFNNHRARAEFLTPDWKEWFVEFTTWTPRGEKQEQLHLDFLLNRTLEAEYDEKLIEIRKRNEGKTFYSWSEQDRSDWEKYNKQPYYWERYHEAADFLKWKPATRETALEMINKTFWTKFTSLNINPLIEPERVNKD